MSKPASKGVKFAPPFSMPVGVAESAEVASKDSIGARVAGDGAEHPEPANSNYKRRRQLIAYSTAAAPAAPGGSSVIARGSHVGLLRRPLTDRAKALGTARMIELANAHAFAARALDRPLNAMLTIVWPLSHDWIGPESWSKLQTRLLDKTTRWLRRRGIEIAFVWVRETVRGHGCHTHIAIHLGARPKKLRTPLLEWLRSAFDFQPRGVHLSFGKTGSRTTAMQAGMLRYLAKGIDHTMVRYVGWDTVNVAAELGIQNRGKQGTIIVKRSGTSQTIGLAARKAAGWREVRAFNAVAELLTPPPPVTSGPPRLVRGKLTSLHPLGLSIVADDNPAVMTLVGRHELAASRSEQCTLVTIQKCHVSEPRILPDAPGVDGP